MKIILKNVSKEIKGVKVLDNINYEFTSGKVYGLKGKNGSGKTMLMRAVSGLIKVKGEVEIDGKILGKDFTFPPSIGILIENPSFVGEYTGIKNLEMLACIKDEIRIDDIKKTMIQVGLDPNDKRTYRKYSFESSHACVANDASMVDKTSGVGGTDSRKIEYLTRTASSS